MQDKRFPMANETTLVGIALVILGYGYFSKLLNRWNISGPMVFTAVGILLSPLGIGRTPFRFNAEAVQLVAQFALILVLFSDASALRLRQLRWGLPARLLFIAMPVTVVLTFLTAKYFYPEAPPLYLMLLALVLAPTDAALGKAVVTDPAVPPDIRNGLNVESGLNDGIVFPLLLTVLLLITGGAGGGEQHGGNGGWFVFLSQQILCGAVAGGIVGYLGGRVGGVSIEKRWMTGEYGNLVPLALAVFAYYFAEAFGGNGYIAAFFGGLMMGNASEKLRRDVENFAESEGELLIMLSFLVFGLVLVPASVPYWDAKAVVFALLSLTVLRMLPTVFALAGTKLDLAGRLFVGWFGPRGIASILYILIAVETIGDITQREYLFAVMTMTVFLSILLHGLSARPLARIYSRHHPVDDTEKRDDSETKV